ncbi:metal ABC transporter permease [Roseobacter sinensis]|uniref:High-affinity zinc uptake system membrane protein ZnuB n=1 Tax=Roseobacter sinensis TaxID=2931391 RepID=A0ABT3BL68_9RHOB|nr:metal ABC transporter permease [Roseobacter sp. WL0113]MCV3274327.1 metal ABC transporter permease [Roseobacter sp. WL0113]
MLDDFLVRAALAGLGVAVAAAPLGCFVVWRRMAYFGDATSHAALLGVALALATDLPLFGGVLLAALGMALLLNRLTGRGLGSDALLGVLAHAALALGLVAVSFLPSVRIDLMSYLVGDILAVSKWDLVVIWTGAAAVLALVGWRWSALLSATLSPDMARASGVDPRREELILTLALAITVAVAIKVVGALLIAALLIIPAAAARPLARAPESMALVAMGIGASSALGGLTVSFVLDTPTGPTIVSLAAGLFALTQTLQAVRS